MIIDRVQEIAKWT